jgi:predicted nucleotidyltransferase
VKVNFIIPVVWGYNRFERESPVNQKQRLRLLNRLSTELAQMPGERIEQVLLYGSYARGEARPHSDLDILIVVRGEFDYTALIRQTSELIAHLSLENDIVISRAFISKERFENERSPFTLNVQREGIPI